MELQYKYYTIKVEASTAHIYNDDKFVISFDSDPPSMKPKAFSGHQKAIFFIDAVHESISQKLIAYLNSHPMINRAELCRKVQLDPGQLSRYLKGQQPLTYKKLHLITETLKFYGFKPS